MNGRDERLMQLRVGFMVLGTLLITAILIVMFGELPDLIYGEYTIYVTFDKAPGVSEDTPVHKSGILIGRVTDVSFAKDEAGREDTRVVVTAAIQGKRKLYHNEICYVQSSLLGDASLEFIRSPDPSLSKAPILDGAELKGQYKPSPMMLVDNWEERVSDLMVTVDEAAKALTSASNSIGDAADRVGKLLDKHEESIDKAVGQLGTTLSSVERVTRSMNNIIGDPQTQTKLRQAMNDLPDTLTRMKSTMALAETNLQNLKEFTDPLSTGGKQRVERFLHAIDGLDELMTQMALFSKRLNNPQGSLSRLLEDRELYHHLSRAARNIDELTRQLKPIVADARVFSDKIARHPELLGVRGAIERRPGIK